MQELDCRHICFFLNVVRCWGFLNPLILQTILLLCVLLRLVYGLGSQNYEKLLVKLKHGRSSITDMSFLQIQLVLGAHHRCPLSHGCAASNCLKCKHSTFRAWTAWRSPSSYLQRSPLMCQQWTDSELQEQHPISFNHFVFSLEKE